jgi:hypothetical protein
LVREVPLGVEELPCDLEGDGGLAGTGGQGEQNALAAVGNCFEDTLNGVVLVIAHIP